MTSQIERNAADLHDLVASSLRAKIAAEAKRLRHHIDGAASAMQAIERHQRMLDDLQPPGLALPIGQPQTYAKLP